MNEIINEIINKQKVYFNSGRTLSINNRKDALIRLKQAIKNNEKELIMALNKDLGKSETEAYMCEVGLVYEEINYMVKNLKRFTKKQKVKTPIAQFRAKSYMLPSPYGNVLVMSPWNYPFLLSFDPVIDAIAAGNTVVLKPSRYSKYTSDIIKKIIEEVFEEDYVSVILGGHEENQILMNSDFDYIFFTGSKNVGKLVYECAAKSMIPVTLELGGKSPCIVDETAKLKLAAKRIVFGKLLNLGQTCVAPDYLYCHESIKDELIKYIKEEMIRQYTDKPLKNEAYGSIITRRHFDRIVQSVNKNEVIHGFELDEERLKISPTIMEVTKDSSIMMDEIFGPILPVMTYKDIKEVIEYVNKNDSPLALYYFTTNKKQAEYVTNKISFGGGCINDTIIHLATTNMGFGGVGASGIGQYHGLKGFETFSHYKSIVDKKNWIDLPMRYQPYKKTNEKLIKMFMK